MPDPDPSAQSSPDHSAASPSIWRWDGPLASPGWINWAGAILTRRQPASKPSPPLGPSPRSVTFPRHSTARADAACGIIHERLGRLPATRLVPDASNCPPTDQNNASCGGSSGMSCAATTCCSGPRATADRHLLMKAGCRLIGGFDLGGSGDDQAPCSSSAAPSCLLWAPWIIDAHQLPEPTACVGLFISNVASATASPAAS